MNTKKSKNKKPNKSPHPNPQQTPENVKVPEKVDDIPTVEKVESELKIDKCAPETISDVITTSEIEKEVEVESPKKPKRNRGKKKKQDKDSETEENQEIEAAQPALVEGKTVPIEIKTSEVEPIVELTVSEMQHVTPTARKKKNKNKKDGNQDTTPQEKFEEKPVIIAISETEKVDVSLDITPDVSVETLEEVKPAKKKNKKKKRHDSEKSDKAEEFSCTAAFQKILNVEDEKTKTIEENQEVLESSISVKDGTIKIGTIESVPADNKDEMLKLVEEHVKEEDVLKPGGGKNKKKNKKGKQLKIEDDQQVQSRSESQCDVVCEENPIISSDIMKPPTDVVMENYDSKVSTENVTLESIKLTEEDTAKLKAKIVKPVDKKHKEKRELEIKGSQSEVSSVSEAPKIDEKENIGKLTTESVPMKEITLQEVIKPNEMPMMEEGKDEAILTSLVELINLPQSSTGKRRKKSPKPAKGTQEIKKENDQENMMHESEKSIKSKDESSTKSKEKPPIGLESVSTIEKQVPSNQQIEPTISDSAIIFTSEPEPIQKLLNVPSEIIHDDIPVSKREKKRKKSPKPPSKLEIVETNEPVKETDQHVTETKQILKKGLEPEHKNDKKQVPSNQQIEPIKSDPAIILASEPETIQEILNVPSEIIHDDVPVSKGEKKRKKSPKPPSKLEIVETSELEHENDKKQVPSNQQIESIISDPAIILASEPEPIQEKLNVPSEILHDDVPVSKREKKRKKSPKPPSKLEIVETSEPVKDTVQNIFETKQILKKEQEHENDKKQEPSNEKRELIISDPAIILTSEPAPIQEILNVPSEITHDDVPVSKHEKKRKKSPKPPSKLKIVETSEPVKETDKNITETKQILKKEQEPEHETDEKSDIFFDMPHMEDIEIRSVKADESEGSTCEVMPDSIQYPRASSQQRVDDNNNTLIQDISQMDVTKLTIPIEIPDTPFIQGDIPLASPEVISSDSIVEKEVPVSKLNEPEKTDLKSKMMEVNQDMEELRLSIEKSLAELTSMEKNEEIIEKKIQPVNIKTDDTAVQEIGSMAIKLEGQITDISTEDKNVTTVTETKSTVSKTMHPASLILPMPTDIIKEAESQKEDKKQNIISSDVIPPPPPMPVDICTKEQEIKQSTQENKSTECSGPSNSPPVCPARKDQKGKGKSKKKGKQEAGQTNLQMESSSTSTKEASKETKKEQKADSSQEKSKQHSNIEDINKDDKESQQKEQTVQNFEPIENFEDAMTSSIDDVNKSFEMIANDAQTSDTNLNPEIKIIAPLEETKIEKKDEKVNPVSQPKNLLGHPVIPARSNRMDYKKEKNKAANALAKVKIKDSVQIEKKQSKESQTDNIQKFMKKKSVDESFSTLMNGNEEFVYKYSFRKVFLPSVCHVCKKDLKMIRVACCYCNLLFYCSAKHKDEDWPQHQALCFAVSTIVHLKDQKHIYEDAKNITGHNYRLLRMQMIVSCEKILKRKLVPWEQETLLYPRICSDVGCREWRQHKLLDCDGCGQMAYCSSHPEHLPTSHKKWCKSYSLYQKLVCHQQTKGRLEPKMPSRVITEQYQIPDTINEVLASMYQEKIDMTDVEYAALSQLATAPLTAVYSFQMYNNKMNSIYANGTYKKTSFTIHVVGAELQFEADALNKWELFFLHLRPDIKNLAISLIASNLNPSNLPLDLLEKVRLCEHCRQDKRRLLFSFQDKKTYSEYYKSDDFTSPDMVCAFNPSIQRSTVHNGKDTWPSTINTILKQKIPFVITSYSTEELCRDLGRIKECSQIDFNVISEPKYNSFSSVRPDRNFITDDEMPLLFKNYCFAVVCGVF